MIKVAINGFGRIGRLVFRIMEDDPEFEVVAINDLTDAEQLAYLLKYDTNHRNYRVEDITHDENSIIVNGRRVRVYSELDPNNLPWKELDIDAVFECTGKFVEKDKAMAHINAGAKKVIISAPAKGDVKTIVYNVNENTLDGSEQIISAASCTTNCLAPVLNVIEKNIGITKGYMTTVHAYTNDQVILDVAHKKGIKARRGRAGAINIIPSSTGAASAIGLVIPSLKGKMNGSSLRVPVPTGSTTILVAVVKGENITVDSINAAMKAQSSASFGYTEEPLVSSDIIGITNGSLFDATQTMVTEISEGLYQVQVVAWYDNENSYTSQMVRTIKYFAELN